MTRVQSSSNPSPLSRWLMAGVSASFLIALGACSPAADTPSQEAPPSSETDLAEIASESLDDMENGRAEATDASMLDTAVEGIDATDAQLAEMVETLSDASEDMRQAESHVHGAANLALALDDATLTIELETPLYNLLGFEHTPETDTQTAAVSSAETALSDPGSLFSFTPDAGCMAAPVGAVTLFSEDDHDHSHKHKDDHSHEHEHHESDHSHDEDHSHDDHDHAHKDALLSYEYICEDVSALAWMETKLFETFSNLENVEFVYLGPSTLSSNTLSASSGRIQLTN